MLETWQEKKIFDPTPEDAYLDALSTVQDAGYLDEYVVRYLGKSHWSVPGDLEDKAFRQWAAAKLPRHRPETRIIGSWNYARKVAANQ
jgi:hypothetical protein